MDQRALHVARQLSPWRVQLELELTRECGEQDLSQVAAGLTPRQDHTFENRDARIAEQQIFGHATARTKSAAGRTGAEGRVEREVTRLQLREGDAADRAAILLRE